jgi:hypothetical protein
MLLYETEIETGANGEYPWGRHRNRRVNWFFQLTLFISNAPARRVLKPFMHTPKGVATGSELVLSAAKQIPLGTPHCYSKIKGLANKY